MPDYKALQRAAQKRQQEMNWGSGSGRTRRNQVLELQGMDKQAKKQGKYTGYGSFDKITDSEWNKNKKGKGKFTTIKPSVTKDVNSYMKRRKKAKVKAPSSWMG